MFVTDLKKSEAVDLTPADKTGEGQLTVRWLLGEPEGAPNFEMRYFSLTGDISTDWHSHQWEHQVFVIQGQGKCRTSEKEIELRPGDAVFVPPGEEHHFICSGEKFDFICVVPKGTRTCMIAEQK